MSRGEVCLRLENKAHQIVDKVFKELETVLNDVVGCGRSPEATLARVLLRLASNRISDELASLYNYCVKELGEADGQ